MLALAAKRKPEIPSSWQVAPVRAGDGHEARGEILSMRFWDTCRSPTTAPRSVPIVKERPSTGRFPLTNKALKILNGLAGERSAWFSLCRRWRFGTPGIGSPRGLGSMTSISTTFAMRR